MSDQVQDFSNPEKIASEFNRMTDDSVLDEILEEPTAPPPKEAPRQQPQRSQGGLNPMISRKAKEIETLEQKILQHETNSAYVVRNDDGSSSFNYIALQVDQVQLGKLRGDLADLRERQRDGERESSGRLDTARRFAQAFIARELPKYPQTHRDGVMKEFARLFKGYADGGEFSKPQYNDRPILQQALVTILDAAYGKVVRGTMAKGDRAPGTSGFDEGDDAPGKPKDAHEGDDDFTNNLMYAHSQRKRGSMSIADQRRADAAAAEKRSGS